MLSNLMNKSQARYVPKKIKKLLVANRGEIAVRVMRTCKELGIKTVAIYSDVDRGALHVRTADEAYRVGEAPSRNSYLKIEKIIDIALHSKVQAIHPGYGFLSENATFAEACTAAGLIFIGPGPESIRSMGDKTTARLMMEKAGVPMAPGTPDAIEDPEEAAAIAEKIGYPVLIKAAAGGGGKGMRLVEDPDSFLSSIEMAQREAESAFGDGRVFIEKYINQPRHIEFQILRDHFGRGVHLFERECSIQRRHQKVVEEAPSCVLTPEIREKMGEAALQAAEECGYTNAGTVEFLVDSSLNFYFMEMNTRLQVEHPVTEMITGLDLVAEQIRVAEGEPLGYSQEDVEMNGHSIECRIYAEDVRNNFLPSPGPLYLHRQPAGPGVRVDAGVDITGEIPIHYDPMISKLIVHASTRADAIERMRRALEEYTVAGVSSTIPFCQFAIDHEAFRTGNFSTHFVQKYFDGSSLREAPNELEYAAAVGAILYQHEQETGSKEVRVQADQVPISPWKKRAWR